MRSLLIAVFAAVAVVFATPACSNEPAIDWSFQSADGESVQLSHEVKKQPVVLFFWATWCPYCKALMPHLQSIRLEYGGEVKILAIHFRGNKDDPVEFVDNAGYDFTLLPNAEDIAKLYEIWGTPGLLVVDSDMNIRFDLRDLPPRPPRAGDQSKSHKVKAAYQAPYWAAELRKTLDGVVE